MCADISASSDKICPFGTLTLLLANVLMCQTATFPHPDVCVFANLQRYIYQSDYNALTSEEKLALLEKGVCPHTPLHGCTDMVMNYAVDWSLLQPAIRLAMAQMHHQQYGIHILDADW